MINSRYILSLPIGCYAVLANLAFTLFLGIFALCAIYKLLVRGRFLAPRIYAQSKILFATFVIVNIIQANMFLGSDCFPLRTSHEDMLIMCLVVVYTFVMFASWLLSYKVYHCKTAGFIEPLPLFRHENSVRHRVGGIKIFTPRSAAENVPGLRAFKFTSGSFVTFTDIKYNIVKHEVAYNAIDGNVLVEFDVNAYGTKTRETLLLSNPVIVDTHWTVYKYEVVADVKELKLTFRIKKLELPDLQPLHASEAGNTALVRADFVSLAVPDQYTAVEMPLRIYERMASIGKPGPGTLKALVLDKELLLKDYEWFVVHNHFVLPRADLSRALISLCEEIDLNISDESEDDTYGDEGSHVTNDIDEEEDETFQPDEDEYVELVDKSLQIEGGLWFFIPTRDVIHREVKILPMLQFIMPPVTTNTWGIPIETHYAYELMGVLRFDAYPQVFTRDQDTQMRYLRYLEEMCEIAFPHFIDAVTNEDISRKQTRPSQKATLLRGAAKPTDYVSKIINCFGKKEAYPTPKSIRPICNMFDQDKEDYSTYTMGIAVYMKENRELFHWYAFGRDNEEIADIVAGKANGAIWVLVTDYTAFDVTNNVLTRTAERYIFTKAYKYVKQVLQLHQNQYRKGNLLHFDTPDGDFVEIPPYYGRHSGSAETSLFNSWINAWIEFCSQREQGKSPSDAWAYLGLYGGDDGVTFNGDAGVTQRVASEAGLRLKCDRVMQGKPFNFLSKKYYSCTWAGVACSAAIATRALGKMHIANKHNVFTKDELLYLKASSYLISDPDCPFIKPLSSKLRELTEDKLTNVVRLEMDFALRQCVKADFTSEIILRGEKMDSILSYNGLRTNHLCDSCATTRSREAEGYDTWLRVLGAARSLLELPQLSFKEKQPVFSSTWTKIFVDDYQQTVTRETLHQFVLECGSSPEMKDHPPREMIGNTRLSSMFNGKEEEQSDRRHTEFVANQGEAKKPGPSGIIWNKNGKIDRDRVKTKSVVVLTQPVAVKENRLKIVKQQMVHRTHADFKSIDKVKGMDKTKHMSTPPVEEGGSGFNPA